MLHTVLQFLGDELNSYLRARTGIDSVVVKASKVVDESGKYAFDEDTLCANIINIEEERILRSHLPEYTLIEGQQVLREPELKLNLYVLFAANFKKYDVALNYLSFVMMYFQSHPSFTSEEYPALDARIGKLIVNLQPLSYEQLNQIWAFIGGKQLPSVVYKVCLVVIQDEEQMAVRPPVTAIKSDIRSR